MTKPSYFLTSAAALFAIACLVNGCSSGAQVVGTDSDASTPVLDGGPRSDAAQVSCVSAGGTCGAISECARGSGQLGSAKYSCGGGTTPGVDVCCFKTPHTCASLVDFDCCANGTASRPSCEDAELVCAAGAVKMAVGHCADVTPVPENSCLAAGGACGAISDCGRGAGQLGSSSYSCGTAAPGTNTCCFKAPTPCGTEPDFDCCLAGSVARPTCDNNKLVCPPNATKAPAGGCPLGGP